MATPFIIGCSIAGAAYAVRFASRVITRARSSHSAYQHVSQSGGFNINEGFNEKMDEKEALDILGLSANATKDQVKFRHKHLIIKNHPDKGGSSYLATKINEARNRLITK
ncbi:hypothetical protein CYY_002996 [Polysphondylium violaceum]|uniref:J domain-containing protein n=1 Tax=Polysphondylium violaceum TaxID=133409 RepID=A0A8J4PX98_9MYCE|nr:hypothetical protein CYY_002996 [Polysphondylium violaceum]